MFERGIYFLCVMVCVMLKKYQRIYQRKRCWKRDMDLNEEENVIMEDSREGHCRPVAADGEYNNNIHVLR